MQHNKNRLCELRKVKKYIITSGIDTDHFYLFSANISSVAQELRSVASVARQLKLRRLATVITRLSKLKTLGFFKFKS